MLRKILSCEPRKGSKNFVGKPSSPPGFIVFVIIYAFHLKRKKNDPTNDISDKTLPEEFAVPRSSLPDQMLIRKEQQHLVKQALAHMTQEFCEVLVLHYMVHLSYEEIAELLGLPVGMVRSRLHRGREETQEYFRVCRTEDESFQGSSALSSADCWSTVLFPSLPYFS